MIHLNNQIKKTEFIGFIFVCVLGTILHFVYDLTGENYIIGLFVPVNESVWEHLKLLYLPYCLYSIYEAVKLSNRKFNVYFSKAIGITAGMITTLSIYYVVLGVTGKQISAVNIVSFFIGVAIAFIVSFLLLTKSIGRGILNGIGAAYLIILGILFMYFTYHPITIPLFLDPQTNTYSVTG